MDKEPRPRAANVSLIEEDPGDDALDRLIDRAIVKDDVCALAAEFEGDASVGSSQRSGDVTTNRSRPRERDLVDTCVFDQCFAGDATESRNDVDHSRGKSSLLADVGKHEGRQRRGLGWFEHDRVASCQRGRDLPREHE